MLRTLTELAQLIERRLDTLVQDAVLNNPPWVASLGRVPSDPTRHADWHQQLRTIVAYRDRYQVNDGGALGPTPSTQGQRLDYRRAMLAAGQAQTTAAQRIRSQRHPNFQTGSGHELGR
ncbi:MAG: hypothetical protein ACYC0H_06400 [Solirubrobacteraceae bacterium]